MGTRYDDMLVEWDQWEGSVVLLEAVISIQIIIICPSDPLMFELGLSNDQPTEPLLTHFQTQSKICSQYIKIASQQLYSSEAQRISQANQLLEQLAQKQKVKDLSEWDVFSTRDSVIFSEQNSLSLSTISLDNRRISRKNALGNTSSSRELEQALRECLQEVERECSGKTVSTVRRVSQEYRRLKGRALEGDRKDKSMRLNEKKIQDLQQKNMILKNHHNEIKIQLEQLSKEYTQAKEELNALTHQLQEKEQQISSRKKIQLEGEILSQAKKTSSKISLLTQVLSDKESLLQAKTEQARKIQAQVESSLFSEEGRCEGCCGMLRRMKGTILSYKKSLQDEALQFEGLFDSFKGQVEEMQLTELMGSQ